jgi:hypothetical protein
MSPELVHRSSRFSKVEGRSHGCDCRVNRELVYSDDLCQDEYALPRPEPPDARNSASSTRVKLLQLGNSIVGAAEPSTKLAVDILYHHDIRVDVGLVARVELSGRECTARLGSLRRQWLIGSAFR